MFENRSKAEEFYLREYDEPDSNQGGSLDQRETIVTAAFPPGELLVGCFSRGEVVDYYVVNLSQYTNVTVTDPEGLHFSSDLACHDAVKVGKFDGDPRADEVRPGQVRLKAEGIMRGAVPGLLDTDMLERPGWPMTSWHSEPRVLVREGRSVALLSLWLGSRWTVRVEACPGHGIG